MCVVEVHLPDFCVSMSVSEGPACELLSPPAVSYLPTRGQRSTGQSLHSNQRSGSLVHAEPQPTATMANQIREELSFTSQDSFFAAA